MTTHLRERYQAGCFALLAALPEHEVQQHTYLTLFTHHTMELETATKACRYVPLQRSAAQKGCNDVDFSHVRLAG